MPLPRAGGFYARSWRDYLARESSPGVPVVRPTVALAAHAFVDEIVLAGFRTLMPVGDQQELDRIDEETRAAHDIFNGSGWLDDPATYFAEPPRLRNVRSARVNSRQGAYERLSFESGYRPRQAEPGRARWLSYTANCTAWVWMLRHEQPRPWLICVHGARMGRPSIDLSLFRARWLHEKLGLNVAFPVLPLHGPRARGLPRTAMFPSEDVLDTVHGAAQGVWDIRRLISWIRATSDDPAIGITGISLGGYTTALVASLEKGLACAIAGIPAVDLVDLLEQHGGRLRKGQLREIVTPARRLSKVVSPLSLTPRVPPEGRFIYAGLADRLLYPRDHVIRLWEHWGCPEIAWYEGGHALFSRAKPVRGFVQAALEQSGLVEPAGQSGNAV